jgi:hypothetical protein
VNILRQKDWGDVSSGVGGVAWIIVFHFSPVIPNLMGYTMRRNITMGSKIY